MNPASFPRPNTPLPNGANTSKHPTCDPSDTSKHPTLQVVKEQVVEEQVVGATILWINSLKTKEKTPEDERADAPRRKGKIKPFLIGKELKTKALRQTAERNGQADQAPKTESKPPDSLRREASQAAARLLRCATALRVTAPHGCGSGVQVWPKGNLSARPHGPNAPLLDVVRCYRTLSNEIQSNWLIRSPPFPS